MLTIKWKGLEKLAKDLQKAQKKAVPYAVRNYLTTAAFEARKTWQNEAEKSFTLRNQYTQRSIIATKPTLQHGTSMQSKVGSFAEYMGDQEEGAVVHGRSGQKGIPGPSAAGLAPGSRRTRTVRAAYRLGAVKAERGVGSTILQRNASAIAMAVRRRNPFVLLHGKDGDPRLFRIRGGRRKWTGKKFRIAKLTMRQLWRFKGSVMVPGSHTLAHTLKALEPKQEHMMQAALLEQLRRHNVLGY